MNSDSVREMQGRVPHVRPIQQSARLDLMTQILLSDLLRAVRLDGTWRGRPYLDAVVRPLARRFARLITDFDEAVGAQGLQSGSQWALQNFAKHGWLGGFEARGQGSVPRSGPLLIVANHPGLYDTLALFASAPRPDLCAIAKSRPHLAALPNVSNHLLYVAEEGRGQSALLRATVKHLKSGGAVATFPGGRNEPDPAVIPGAVEALEQWSSSADLFARLVPKLIVVPAVISGVLSPKAQRHPLTYLRRRPEDRQRLGTILQTTVPWFRDVHVKVTFSQPIDASNLARDKNAVSNTVKTEIRRLMEEEGA